MTTTRRIQYHRYGGPDVLRLEEFEVPAPARGQVLVRVRAAAANPMDWQIRDGGMKPLTGGRFPRGLGHDFAGVVEAVGSGVTRLKVGDEVLGAASIRSSGAFAELVIADEKVVATKPADLAFTDAATLPIAALTAYQALHKVGKVHAGQAVFITGCLGAVGRAATQIALGLGATVGGSCRASAVGEARELGVDPILDFEFDPAPLRQQFDVVFDTAGSLPYATARTLVKPGGRIIDIKPNPVKMVRSVLPGPFHALIASPNATDLAAVAGAAAAGTLRLPIARTVPLDDAIEAMTELEQNRAARRGKLVVTTD
jgi:NADPH:quinone reductase-like Zn-dependent oxidoreductase